MTLPEISLKDEHYMFYRFAQLYGADITLNYGRILALISRFIDGRTEVLQTKNIGLRLVYTASDEQAFYDTCGIDKTELIRIIKSSKHIKQHIPDATMPIYNAIMLVMCYLHKHNETFQQMYNLKDHAAKYLHIYLALRVYSISQRQIVKYPPKEELMEYTINNLSNKYKITKSKNLYSLLIDDESVNNSSLNIDFSNIKDAQIHDYVSKLINRTKSTLKYIFNQCIINADKKLYSRVEDLEATNAEDGKKFLRVSENISNTIDILTKKVLNSFIQDINVRENLVQVACKRAGKLSQPKLKIILKSIRDSNDEKLMKEMISNILSYWLISQKKSSDEIHSVQFIKKCSTAYAISNTYDIFIIRLKEVLKELLIKYGSDYIDTEKRSTINQFRQAIFLYMVLYISTIR